MDFNNRREAQEIMTQIARCTVFTNFLSRFVVMFSALNLFCGNVRAAVSLVLVFVVVVVVVMVYAIKLMLDWYMLTRQGSGECFRLLRIEFCIQWRAMFAGRLRSVRLTCH